MKATTLALAAALTGFAATAAHAESRLYVGIGVNAAPVYRTAEPAYCPPAPVYAAPAPVYVAPRGHWEDVTTKSWIPARWIETRNYWGHRERVLEPAHFAFTTNRVWVEDRRYHGYDRDDRGYGHDRDDDRGYGRDGYRHDNAWGYGYRR